jgi:hypothetical protein
LPLSFNGAITALANYNVGIGSDNLQTKLQVEGTIFTSIGTAGLPGFGTTGSGGSYRLILFPGSAGAHPFGLGIAGDTLWNGVPATSRYE